MCLRCKCRTIFYFLPHCQKGLPFFKESKERTLARLFLHLSGHCWAIAKVLDVLSFIPYWPCCEHVRQLSFPMCLFLSRMRSLLHLKPLKVVNCRRVARIPRHFSGFPRCTSFAQRLAFLLTRIGSWPGGMDVGSAQANSWNHVLPCCSLSGREHFLSPSHMYEAPFILFFLVRGICDDIHFFFLMDVLFGYRY